MGVAGWLGQCVWVQVAVSYKLSLYYFHKNLFYVADNYWIIIFFSIHWQMIKIKRKQTAHFILYDYYLRQGDYVFLVGLSICLEVYQQDHSKIYKLMMGRLDMDEPIKVWHWAA